MSHTLSFFAWNINGNVSKLELNSVFSAFSPCDIVILSELKTVYKVEAPGFVSLRSSVVKDESARGGVLVLFKNYIHLTESSD